MRLTRFLLALAIASGMPVAVAWPASGSPGGLSSEQPSLRVAAQTERPQPAGGFWWSTSLLPKVSVSSSNGASGFAREGDTITVTFTSAIEIDRPVVTVFGRAATVAGDGTNWSASITARKDDPEGPVFFSIGRCKDKLGRTGPTVTMTTDGSAVVFDRTLPSGEAFAKNGVGRIRIDWNAVNDDGSGIARYVLLGGIVAPATCSQGAPLYSGMDRGYTHAGLADGETYHYLVCASDRAGNTISFRLSATAVPEDEPPVIRRFAIEQPRRPEYVVPQVSPDEVAATRNPAVTLVIDAHDRSTIGWMCISLAEGCTNWEPFKPRRSYMLTATNGLKTVRLWLRDAWGNTTQVPASATTVLDTVRPLDGYFTAAGNDGEVNLAWGKAVESGSGVAAYRILRGPSPPSSCPASVSSPPAAPVIEVYSGSATFTSETGLTNGTTYAYRLCSYDKAGNVSTGRVATVVPGVSSAIAGVSLASGTTRQYGFSAACASTGCIAAIQDGPSIHAQRYGSNGLRTGGPVIADAAGSTPSVATDGVDFLLVWRGHVDQKVHSLRIDGTDGSIPASSTVVSGSIVSPLSRQSVIFDGANYLVVWSDATSAATLYGQYVRRDGRLLGAPVVIARGSGRRGLYGMAAGTGGTLVAYADGSDGGMVRNPCTQSEQPVLRTVKGQMLASSKPDSAGVPIGPGIGITKLDGAVDDDGVQVASDGTDFLVVFAESAGGSICANGIMQPGITNIHAENVRVANPSDASSVIVSAGARDHFPSVAWNGVSYLVTWARLDLGAGRGLAGRYLGRNGLTFNRQPMNITGGTGMLAGGVAGFRDGRFNLIWTDGVTFTKGGFVGTEVFGAFMGSITAQEP